ncbi:MAG: GNAT family N-acetyltransferase [Candidatus Thermoplasmatota archaeon]|nr:GNAT family N-acetyltransferase [Candidatus Thermoplasmatota archaeon]
MEQKKIRLAVEADWQHISRISKASGYMDYINNMGRAYMSEGTILVCEIDMPCGFLKIEMLPDGSAWLSGIRVGPEHWRQGIGDSMTNAALVFAISRGASFARMLIHNENQRSVSLALKNGFVKKSVFHFYEGRPDITEMVESAKRYDTLVNVGWRFANHANMKEKLGSLLTDGGSSVFIYHDHEETFQFMEMNEEVMLIPKGITCVPDHLGSFIKNGKKLEGFEEASVYEKPLS